MGAQTEVLKLYMPGGGSLGIGGADEVLDVDKLNQNSQKIDAFAKGWGTPDERNQQFYGLAAGRSLLTGMKHGDTYQDADGSKRLWRYDGTNWTIDPTNQIYGKAWKLDGFQAGTSSYQIVTGMGDLESVGGVTLANNRLKAPVAGRYELRANVYFSGSNPSFSEYGFNVTGTDPDHKRFPAGRIYRNYVNDAQAAITDIVSLAANEEIGLVFKGGPHTVYGPIAATRNNDATWISLRYVGP